MTPQQALPLILLLLFRIGETQAGALRQTDSALVLHQGENVTLSCSHSERYVLLYWLKLTAGHKPLPVATRNKYGYKYGQPEMQPEFEGSTRFDGQPAAGVFHLNIRDVQPSDSALYCCVLIDSGSIEFSNGTLLTVKGSDYNHRAVNHLLPETGSPGDTSNGTREYPPESRPLLLPLLVSALTVSLVIILTLIMNRTLAAKVTSPQHISPIIHPEEEIQTVDYVALDFTAHRRRAGGQHSNAEKGSV